MTRSHQRAMREAQAERKKQREADEEILRKYYRAKAEEFNRQYEEMVARVEAMWREEDEEAAVARVEAILEEDDKEEENDEDSVHTYS